MTTKRKRRTVRFLFAGILGLILLQVIAVLLAAPLLEVWLTNEVSKRSSGQLSLAEVDLSLHPSSGFIGLKNVLLVRTDSASQDTLLRLEIPQAELHIPRIRRWTRKKEMIIPFLRLRQPVLTIKKSEHSAPSSPRPITPDTLFNRLERLFSGKLKGIEVGELDIRDATFRLTTPVDFRTPFEARDISLSLENWRLYPNLLQQRIPFEVDKAQLELDAQHYRFSL
ncbi:MAG: hypothetical protein AAFV07_09930, partial [Bacteroidota bacterium]